MIIQIYFGGKMREGLLLNDKEALRVSEILLTHANELNSTGDLKAAMLGSLLEKCASLKIAEEGRRKNGAFRG